MVPAFLVAAALFLCLQHLTVANPTAQRSSTLTTTSVCAGSGVTCADLVENFVGPGIIAFNASCNDFCGGSCASVPPPNPCYRCCAALGLFSGGNQVIGVDAGVVLSTGIIQDLTEMNNAPGKTQALGKGSDPDLTFLLQCSPGQLGCFTQDKTVLEFDFIVEGVCAQQSALAFQYVFASEEYNEWILDVFNDVFAFFLNGENIALLPGSPPRPVTIHNLNCGAYIPEIPKLEAPEFNTFLDCLPYGGPNCTLFRNNDFFPNPWANCGGTQTLLDTQMDGFTVVLTASGLRKSFINHIKIAIADTADSTRDSNVFLKAGSFGCQVPTGACCDLSTGSCQEGVLAANCVGNWGAGVTCAQFRSQCAQPRMLVLLDRTGSMRNFRSSTGHTRCRDALDQAKEDVVGFFTNNPNGKLAVWTFRDNGPTPQTNGFVDEAAALSALFALDPEDCDALTPLAESMCAAVDALVAETSDPASRVLAVSSDGGENHSDGPCFGPWSLIGTDCDTYALGSWQKRVCDKVRSQAVVMTRYWGAINFANSGAREDVETGQSFLGGVVTDLEFFRELAAFSGGLATFMEDDRIGGACTVPGERCRDAVPPGACQAGGGLYRGDNSRCVNFLSTDIPVTSSWGLAVISLTLVCAGTLFLRKAARNEA